MKPISSFYNIIIGTSLLSLISGCKINYSYSSNLRKATPQEMDSLYVEGLKHIWHDNLVRFNFTYAHQIKKEIKLHTPTK